MQLKSDRSKLRLICLGDKETAARENQKVLLACYERVDFSSFDEEKIARVFKFNDNDWLVITPEGYFDGSSNAWQQLLRRFDNNTFNYAPVEAFFKELYYP